MNYLEIENGILHIKNNDKKLAVIIDRADQCSIKPKKNYYEMLLRSIIQQQLSVTAATSIYKKFLTHFEKKPLPEKILKTPHEVLRSLGLSNAKAKYIKDLSEKIFNSEIKLNGIGKKQDNEIIEILTKVKGIGVWTVHMFLIFTLGRLNILPVGDLGLKRAIMNVYKLKNLPSEKKIIMISKQNCWEPYNSIACWYLWASLEL